MPGRISKGTCNLCGGTFAKNIITRHLQSCPKRKDVSQAAPGRRSTKLDKSFHLRVEGRYAPEYWMHLQVPLGMKLDLLDDFLRDTWLECCGHLSAFRINGKSYTGTSMDGFDDENMTVALGEILHPKLKFYHEYDFGTTTELTLSVLSEEEFKAPAKGIKVLARNDPPAFTCGTCGKAATQICTECMWEGEGLGLLCGKCVAKHACEAEMFLPVVNSPRVGMCGYEG